MTALASQALKCHGLEHLPDGKRIFNEVHNGPIALLHDVARALSCSQQSLLKIKKAKAGLCNLDLTELGSKVAMLLDNPWKAIATTYRHYKLSPQFALFNRIWRHIPTGGLKALVMRNIPLALAQEIASRVDRMTKYVRLCLTKQATRNAINNFCRGPRDNFGGLMNGLDWIAQRERFVWSIRIDLYWDDQSRVPLPVGDQLPLDLANAFLDARYKFQQHVKRMFGEALLGFAWAFEFGEWSHFHTHCWIILKRSAIEDDLLLVEQLGACWKRLSGGEGRGFHSSNSSKSAFRYLAVGLIDLHDERVINGVRAIAIYFTAAGLFVKLNLGGRKAFGKPHFPTEPIKKPGRKSKVEAPVLRIPMHLGRDAFANWI